MKNHRTTPNGSANRRTGGGEQLTLLPPLPSSDAPARFKLSAATRERGLRHIAEIRQMLEAREAERQAERSARHHHRRPAA